MFVVTVLHPLNVLDGPVYLHAVFAVEPTAELYVPPATDTPDRLLHCFITPDEHHVPLVHWV